MATTKIWAIKKRLDHVIDYATNPSKTSKEMYSDLHNVLEYAKASYKTEEQLYVTGINCNEKNAYDEMIRTKKMYGKTGGILGFHAFQSFAEGEVTPEQAHKIGVKLAEELWGDRFQVVVTTHLNTNHIHNHFCLNSVSFKDGKKYYDNHANYALMRETSDRLCEENSLSVLEEKKCKKSNIDYSNFYKSKTSKSNYYMNIKDDIDFAIDQAYSYKDFLDIMKKMNYEVINRYGRLSVKPSNKKRNIRIERAFGDEYKIENINKKIYETESIRIPFPEVRTLNGKYKGHPKFNKRRKIKGIRALYFHYCYLLKVYPKNRHKFSKAIREDIKKMDKLSSESKWLVKTGMQTEEELLWYKRTTTRKMRELQSKREKLYKKQRNTKTFEEKQVIDRQKIEINNEIKQLKSEIVMIEDIESRVPKLKENIKEEQETQNIKDKSINEKGELV